MSLAISAFAPEPIFTRRAHRQNMARAAKAFSAISLGAAFVLTTGEAGAQSARASAEDGFSPISGTPLGFNDDGDLIVVLADGSETVIPRGEYGLVGDQIMVSDMIQGVEVAQNGYIPPTSGAPVYGSTGPLGLGYAAWAIPLGLVAVGVLAYLYVSRSNNDAPVLGSATYSDTVDEGAAVTDVLFTASATDAEGDTFSYSLSGADAGSFDIDPASGEVTFDSVPDFEPAADSNGDNIYSFNVVATDEHGEASSSVATVTLTDTSTALGASANPASTAGSQDISYAAAITAAIDTGAGDDDILLSAGIGTGGSVDAGSGADVVRIEGVTAGGNAVDMGTGEDLLQIKADVAASLAVDLGSDNDVDIVEIAVVQTQTHVITNFDATAEDVVDVSAFSMLGGLDTTAHASTADAIAAISLTNSITYETATNLVYIDADADGVWDGAGTDVILDLSSVTTLDSTDFLI